MARVEAETARLSEWFDARFEEQLDFSPIEKTMLGRKDDYEALIDFVETDLPNADEVATGVGRTRVLREGWALYAEWLAKEMGAYQDPYSDFGRLSTELWRAIRLVLDTGLHARAWTEEQAVEYFMANSPAAEGQIRSEVRRYIVWPGQATSYKIGMLKIMELRERAEAEGGSAFDIRGFHDTVLGGGALPLSILERRLDDWIAALSSDRTVLPPAPIGNRRRLPRARRALRMSRRHDYFRVSRLARAASSE